MRTLREVEEFDRLRAEALVIIFKHSAMCGISALADREALAFLSNHPEHEIYKVDVTASRPLSDHIEATTGIRHESPQLLVLRLGDVVWHGSHSRVTADAIAASLG